MEMPARWKPQNGFHSALEISHSTRDSHISTAAPCVSRQDDEEEHDERHAVSRDGWTTDARLEHAKARASREGTQGGKVLRKRGPILLRTDRRFHNLLAGGRERGRLGTPTRLPRWGPAPPGAEPTPVTSALGANTGRGCSRTGPAKRGYETACKHFPLRSLRPLR